MTQRHIQNYHFGMREKKREKNEREREKKNA